MGEQSDIRALTEIGDESDAAGARAALVLVHVADFAALRRSLGLAGSERLAMHVAERIAALLHDAVVLPVGRDLVEVRLRVAEAAELEETVAEIRANAGAVELGNGAIAIRLRIGSAMGNGADEADQVALLEAAEASLTRDGGSISSEPGPTQRALDGLGEELRIAIARGDLFLQYQPKLHLRRREITSIEALIRWRHPQRGLVMPGDFIAAAERCGAIKAMTLWTLRQVIADQRLLARNGYDLPVFINIAGVLLSDRDFVAAACAIIGDGGERLGFEITETSVIREPALAIAHLQQFAGIGVAITIDDYGAGLSSLAYLKQLPARELKIDKLFVTQLSSSHRDPLIVRSTIDLAHALEMEVVAEGVETATSLALLTVMGCDMVQGFLISHPLGLEALLAFLREDRHQALFDQPRSPLQQLAAVRARA